MSPEDDKLADLLYGEHKYVELARVMLAAPGAPRFIYDHDRELAIAELARRLRDSDRENNNPAASAADTKEE